MRLLLSAFLSLLLFFPTKGQVNSPALQRADSLFTKADYAGAGLIYEKMVNSFLRDPLHLNRLGYTEYIKGDYGMAEKHYQEALSLHPSPPLKASLFSRLARTSALKNKDSISMNCLDSAVSFGFLAIWELDTASAYTHVRNYPRFQQIRARLFNSIYPCMANQHAREFDFWIGEWDVYVTGTDQKAGTSAVQKISGGCALLENWESSISSGKSLNFVDDSTHKWKQVWVGSYQNGQQDFTNGEYRDSAMRFGFETRDAQGHSVIGRFTFFNQGTDQVRQLNETSADHGQTWTASYDFTYRRKKGQ